MGYRMNKEMASSKQFREELERVRRHLSEAVDRLDAAAYQIPAAEMISEPRITDAPIPGSSATSAIIGLELAIADVQQNADQLLEALQKMNTADGNAMGKRSYVWPRL